MPDTLFWTLPKLPGACQVAAGCCAGFTEVITTLGVTGQTSALATCCNKGCASQGMEASALNRWGHSTTLYGDRLVVFGG